MFVETSLDGSLSPLTGWTRETWLDCGEWILTSALRGLPDMQGPLIWPRPSEILYPQPEDPPLRFRAAELEGLARTLLIAAPVLKERDLVLDGISLRDWYRDRLARGVDPASEHYLGPVSENVDFQQQIVEGAALVMAFWAGECWLWAGASETTRRQVLDFILKLGSARTNAHNWRFFNVLMLSFAHQKGRQIDQAVLQHHLQQLLQWATGDGYFRDGERFDYYGAWAFQVYAPLWIHHYGREHLPEYADEFTRHLSHFAARYDGLFARDGRHIVWGRSSIYRVAASSPLAAMSLIPGLPLPDWGYLRRLCSGNLKRFMQDAEVWKTGIPSAGLHGTFEPMLQAYSCAASPFWFAKIFTALAFQPDHPFWTATENQGPWERQNGARTTQWPQSGLFTVARPDGSSELISTKVRTMGGAEIDPGYGCMSYHSHFPWSARSHGLLANTLMVSDDAGEHYQGAKQRASLGVKNDFVLSQYLFPYHYAILDVAMLPLADGAVYVIRNRLNAGHQMCLCGFSIPEAKLLSGAGTMMIAGPDHRWEAFHLIGPWEAPGVETVEAAAHPERKPAAMLSVRSQAQTYSCLDALVVERRYSVLRQKHPPSPFVISVESGPLGQAGPLTLLFADGQVKVLDFGPVEGRLEV